MKHIDLSCYKKSMPFFNLFDIYFKEQKINKEYFLLDNDITPSTYRTCRKIEHKIGPKIINTLSEKFSFKAVTDSLIDEIEDLLNNIYYDMYYKNYKHYDFYMNKISDLLKENYLIFPILELMYLFLIASSNVSIRQLIIENEKLYQKVKKYEIFFKGNLIEIYELLYLMFETDISQDYWIKNYTNASAYFILASKSYMNKKYIETLFFAEKSKKILFEDGNIIRLLYLNNTIMSSLIFVGNFEECYVQAFKQSKVLDSLDINKDLLAASCQKYMAISMLGMNCYKEILKKYLLEDNVTITMVICILIALYQVGTLNKNFKEYHDYYNNLDVENLIDEYKDPIKLLDKFLVTKKKTLISELLEFETMTQFEKILEKI